MDADDSGTLEIAELGPKTERLDRMFGKLTQMTVVRCLQRNLKN